MADDVTRRITEWLEAAPSVLDMVSRLLDEHGRLWETTEAAERECTRLRQELATVCAENDRLVKTRSEVARLSPAAAPAGARAAAPATIPTRVSPPAQPSKPGPWRILLADDDANFRCMIIDYLSDNRGYDVLPAVSGEEALTLVPRFRPHAVLLDLAMPGGGMWAIEEIKRLHPELCLIVVSGNDDVSVVRKARALGAADYVTKPFDLDCLDAVLDTHRTRALRPSPPVAMAAAAEEATLPAAAWFLKSYVAQA